MDEIKQLAEEFRSCQKLLTAIGDENRLHLMVEMMQMNRCRSVRVGEITKRTHLSRPARPGRMNSTLCPCSFGCTGILRAERKISYKSFFILS